MIDFLNIDDTISDEMLAAYIDGNTSLSESAMIENSLQGNSLLSEAVDVAKDSITFGGCFDWDIHKGDFGFWELGLPPVVPEEDIANWIDDNNEIEDYSMADIFNSQMQVYGEAGENLSDPIYIQQPDDHSCALRSQQIVLRDFGIDIPFDKLEQIALEYGVYTNKGTNMYDVGKVLELAGVKMHQVTGSTMHNLMNELAQGHRVIVSVDANELWDDHILKNWFDDVFGRQGGNHALIVAGVEINQNDVSDVKVVLTDPGSGDLRIEYPAEQFIDAWKDSNCFMAATDNPAPFQYDANTGMEVPSNFAIQQHFNHFIADNSYQLSPDLINIPSNYHPAFTGHLDMVGSMDYNTFAEQFNAMNTSNDYANWLSTSSPKNELNNSYNPPFSSLTDKKVDTDVLLSRKDGNDNPLIDDDQQEDKTNIEQDFEEDDSENESEDIYINEI